MHGERRSKRERERGKGKRKGKRKRKRKGKRAASKRGVERWLGIYDVPVHELDEGARKRKDGGKRGNKGWLGGKIKIEMYIRL